MVYRVEHETGRPVLVLHGAGVDHREAEACFEPARAGAAGLWRIYPDLPGMGRTIVRDTVQSADDMLDTLLGFGDEVTAGYAAAVDIVDQYQRATLAVLDDSGHALPHEQPELLCALLTEWLVRVERWS